MYILDLETLQIGDIILSKSDSEISQLVRRITGSQFSHARLYVGVSTCIDSDGYGVQSNNVQRLLFENEADVVVLRLRDSKLTDRLANVETFARQKIGTEYSTSEAKIAALRKEEHSQQPNRQFCTRFVAQAYSSAGISISKNPDYCLPEDLLNSESLKVVECFLRTPSAKEIEFAQSENPLQKQAEIHNKIFKKAREISGQDIQTFEQLSELIISNPDLDEELTSFISESGYLSLTDSDKEKNPWHYDSRLMIEYYTHPEAIINTALFFAENESQTRERFLISITTLIAANKIYPRKYFEMLISLYKKLILFSHERETAALGVFKHF